jgi:hypothetical protein
MIVLTALILLVIAMSLLYIIIDITWPAILIVLVCVLIDVSAFRWLFKHNKK